MISLPTVKSTAVTSAPVATSAHASSTSGRNLKSSANSAVVTASERRSWRPAGAPESLAPTDRASAERRDGGARRQRHHQQETDRDDQSERAQPIDEELPQVSVRRRLHAPDRVERRLQLEERAARRQHERDPAGDRGNGVVLALRRPLQQRLNGLAAFGADEPVNLADDLAAHRVGPEDRARDRDGDDQDRRDRKQRVERHRRPKSKGVVVPPRRHRRPKMRTMRPSLHRSRSRASRRGRRRSSP